jgi:hypothetical protein
MVFVCCGTSRYLARELFERHGISQPVTPSFVIDVDSASADAPAATTKPLNLDKLVKSCNVDVRYVSW